MYVNRTINETKPEKTCPNPPTIQQIIQKVVPYQVNNAEPTIRNDNVNEELTKRILKEQKIIEQERKEHELKKGKGSDPLLVYLTLKNG